VETAMAAMVQKLTNQEAVKERAEDQARIREFLAEIQMEGFTPERREILASGNFQ